MNNSLKYVRILESTGINREQAEAHIHLITEMMENDLEAKLAVVATKQDLKNLEVRFDTSIERLEHKMLQLEYRMTIKLGTIVTVALAAVTTIIKFL